MWNAGGWWVFTAHRHLPLRCAGAFADEPRIVAQDAGGRVYRFACASLAASFAAGASKSEIARRLKIGRTSVRRILG